MFDSIALFWVLPALVTALLQINTLRFLLITDPKDFDGDDWFVVWTTALIYPLGVLVTIYFIGLVYYFKGREAAQEASQ